MQVILSIYIVFALLLLAVLIGPFLPPIKFHSYIYEWMPLACPLYIELAVITISKHSVTDYPVILSSCAIILASICLWLLQINFVCPPLSHHNAKLSQFQ